MELDTQTHHPNPQPQPHHRKIELQSPLDLTYLQQNLAKTALSKLDLHFPPIPKPATVISLDGSSQNPSSINKPSSSNNSKPEVEIEPDPLRTKVQSLISSFLLQTWQSAQSNITLNGLDPSPTTNPIPASATLESSPPSESQSSDPNSATDKQTATTEIEPIPPPEIEGKTFQYQPFDPKLQSKLASLYSDLEKLTAEVSQLRRTAPKSGANNYISSLDSLIEKEDTSHAEEVQQMKSQTGDEQNENNIESASRFKGIEVRQGWNEDLKEIYTRGKAELDSLAGVAFNDTADSNGDRDGDGGAGGNGKRKREPSLTETMGKIQRARTVALDME